jgi:hypothetical protein
LEDAMGRRKIKSPEPNTPLKAWEVMLPNGSVRKKVLGTSPWDAAASYAREAGYRSGELELYVRTLAGPEVTHVVWLEWGPIPKATGYVKAVDVDPEN